MHRDLKLANILLHFPDKDLFDCNEEEKREFISNVDLRTTKFEIKIADLGFAKEVEDDDFA